MPGHVFIALTDIRQLACDAWLMPCDYHFDPLVERWRPAYEPPLPDALWMTYKRPSDRHVRVVEFPDWPTDKPQPWLVHLGMHQLKEADWYVAPIPEFLRRAYQKVATPKYRRSKALLALPLIGTGYGGARERPGEILEKLLPVLYDFVRDHDADVVLCCFERAHYAAAQAERVKMQQRGRVVWPAELGGQHRQTAEDLATRANNGTLALFLGAGVSQGAGLPGWDHLIGQLAEKAGMDEEKREALRKGISSNLDQATIIANRLLRQGTSVGAAIKEILKNYTLYSLSHALLASLPVREVMTTNYDQLFEGAWNSPVRGEISILPGSPKQSAKGDPDRWLLKMHGCLSDPDKIVLTRESYIRYEANLPALAGIVQAFLLTRHVLFVGFSLTDDNFHRIFDAVRHIRPKRQEGFSDRDNPLDRVGTAMSLFHGKLIEELWEEDLNTIAVSSLDEQHVPEEKRFEVTAHAARPTQILLDFMLAQTRGMEHLLDPKRYGEQMSNDDKALSGALERLVASMRTIQETGVAFRHVASALGRLGFSDFQRKG